MFFPRQFHVIPNVDMAFTIGSARLINKGIKITIFLSEH